MIVEALIVAKGIYDYNETKNNKEKSERITNESMMKIVESKENIVKQYDSTENSLVKLANRRSSIYKSTFNLFLNIMQPLDLVEFSDRELSLMNDMRKKVDEYIGIINKNGISKTSITATEAITSYLLFGIPGYLKKKSELELEQSKILRKSSDLYEIHSINVVNYLKYIEEQCNIMSELTLRFNILLINSLNSLKEIIEVKGNNKMLYTKSDRELMRFCFNLADSIKKITDPSIIENDQISKAFVDAINFGNEQLEIVNKLIETQRANLQQFKLR